MRRWSMSSIYPLSNWANEHLRDEHSVRWLDRHRCLPWLCLYEHMSISWVIRFLDWFSWLTGRWNFMKIDFVCFERTRVDDIWCTLTGSCWLMKVGILNFFLPNEPCQLCCPRMTFMTPCDFFGDKVVVWVTIVCVFSAKAKENGDFF